MKDPAEGYVTNADSAWTQSKRRSAPASVDQPVRQKHEASLWDAVIRLAVPGTTVPGYYEPSRRDEERSTKWSL